MILFIDFESTKCACESRRHRPVRSPRPCETAAPHNRTYSIYAFLLLNACEREYVRGEMDVIGISFTYLVYFYVFASSFHFYR